MRNALRGTGVVLSLGMLLSNPLPALADQHEADWRGGRHHLEVGPMVFWRDYKEDPPRENFKSTETGTVPGVKAQYTFDDTSWQLPWFGRAFVEWADGDTDFDGTTQTGTPVEDETGNTFLQAEGQFGYSLEIPWGGFRLTPYTGFGYWFWRRELGGQAPFTEDYDRLYVPVGVRYSRFVGSCGSIEADLAGEIMVAGDIDIEDIDGIDDTTLDLGNRPSLRFETRGAYHFNRTWSVAVGPFYRWVRIGESNTREATSNGFPTGIAFTEPTSRAHVVGGTVSLRWSL